MHLRSIIQNFPAPEEESLLLTSFIDQLGSIDFNVADQEFDFKPLRYDYNLITNFLNLSPFGLGLIGRDDYNYSLYN